MAQYCRYCSNLIVGDFPYCDVKKKIVSESYAKRTNTCKEFQLNSIDAFGENLNGYKPKKKKEVGDNNVTLLVDSDMRKVTEGDFVSTEYEDKILSGIITGAKKNPADGEWFVQLTLPDMRIFICPASALIDCVFVGDGE